MLHFLYSEKELQDGPTLETHTFKILKGRRGGFWFLVFLLPVFPPCSPSQDAPAPLPKAEGVIKIQEDPSIQPLQRSFLHTTFSLKDASARKSFAVTSCRFKYRRNDVSASHSEKYNTNESP